MIDLYANVIYNSRIANQNCADVKGIHAVYCSQEATPMSRRNVPQILGSRQEFDAVDRLFDKTARTIQHHTTGAERVDYMDGLVLALNPLLPADQLARIASLRNELATTLRGIRTARLIAAGLEVAA